MSLNSDTHFTYHLRQITGATLATSISAAFVYASTSLFISNQRNYLRNFKNFLHTKSNCRAVLQPQPTNENKLVYICADINPNDDVSDDIFQINLKPNDENIIYLYRECEIYQWTQSHTKQYFKIWCSEYLDSSNSEETDSHQNPSNMIQSKLFHTKHFTVSGFTFDLKQNESITEPKVSIPMLLKHAQLLKHYEINLNGNKPKLTNDHSQDGWYYFTNNDHKEHNIGDIRVRFWIIKEAVQLTIIGTQNEKKISISTNDYDHRMCLRWIGKYQLDKALKRYFHVKLINHETGSIFVMTQIALSCFIYAAEIWKLLYLDINNEKPKDCDLKTRNLKVNELGLQAFFGAISICGPIYGLSSLYPYLETFHVKHPVLMNSMCVLAAASVVVSAHRFVR